MTKCPRGHEVQEGQHYCGYCGTTVLTICPNGHENVALSKFCFECGSPIGRLNRFGTGLVPSLLVGSVVLVVLDVLLVVVAVAASVARSDSPISRSATEPQSHTTEAVCEDGAGDVDFPVGAVSMASQTIDITSATLTRENGELTSVLALEGPPPRDVAQNESQGFTINVYDEDGDTLYSFDYSVSHVPLNDHDLEATGSEFGDAATVDENGIHSGVPIEGTVQARLEGTDVVVQADLDDLPQLPDHFFWTANTSFSALETDGSLSMAFDSCPVPYPADADAVSVSTWAASSDGTTVGEGVETTTSPSTIPPSPDETLTTSTNAVTGEPCYGASGCAYENGIDFDVLRRTIAAALIAGHEAVDPQVDCNSPNLSPPNQIPPGEVIVCEAVDANGSAGTVEVAPEGSGRYTLTVTEWSSGP